jgi:hypothetical protein
LERDGVRAVEASIVCLVHNGVCVLRLIGHDVDGSLEDVALLSGQA